MITLARPSFETGGNFGSPKIDLGGCVLYLPLWRQELANSPFLSSGVYGIPSHTCTVTGATWGNQGRTFDGTDDRIDCGINAVLLSAPFTLMAWVKPTLQTINALANWGTTAGNAYPAFYMSQITLNLPLLYLGSANFRYWNSVTATLFDGNWHLVTFIVTGLAQTDVNNAAMYVDTTLQTAGLTLATGAVTTPTQFDVGWTATGGYKGKGIFGEVIAFNYALSLAEIQQNYLATKWRYQ